MAKLNEETSVKTEKTNSNVDVNILLDRLNKLEDVNKNLQSKLEQNEKLIQDKLSGKINRSKKYEWPRGYRFKIFDWMPVLNYVSKKRDNRRSLVYTQHGMTVEDNHILELTLWDSVNNKETKQDVVLIEFEYETSVDHFADVEKTIKNGKEETWYIFKTDDFWTFKVAEKIIN